MMRTYSELLKLKTFEDRFRYLMLNGVVGADTFGFDRYLNQLFSTSPEWRSVRTDVILRDFGCDLGITGLQIEKHAIVHHMNPITVEDIVNRNRDILNPEYLITTTLATHNAIHYGDETYLNRNTITIRVPNDTCPWKGSK